MAILRVRDKDGKVTEIPAIKGDKGDKGDSGAAVFGSYTGNGDSQDIDLGLKAEGLFIYPSYYSEEKGVILKTGSSLQLYGMVLAELYRNQDGTVTLKLRKYTDVSGVEHTALNKQYDPYDYIAFVSE